MPIWQLHGYRFVKLPPRITAAAAAGVVYILPAMWRCPEFGNNLAERIKGRRPDECGSSNFGVSRPCSAACRTGRLYRRATACPSVLSRPQQQTCSPSRLARKLYTVYKTEWRALNIDAPRIRSWVAIVAIKSGHQRMFWQMRHNEIF
jgi:hypothetical protein